MSISEFVYTYFILPYEANQGYNLVNSLAYGLLLIGVLYVMHRILKHYDFKITNKLVYSVLTFVLFGSSLRVLEDAGILPKTFLLVTPSIYFLVMGVTSVTIIACHKLFKEPEKKIFITGTLLSLVNLSLIHPNNWHGLAIITAIFTIITLLMTVLRRRTAFLKDNLNFLGVAAHMLDATATFVTLDLFSHLGYWEQHPLTRLIGTLGGSYLWFYIAKLLVVAVLYYIDKDVKNHNMKLLLKFAVIVLGLAPGVRDTLRLTMLV
jgi:uncharacterized membrane protein